MECGYVCFNDRAYLGQTLMDFPQIWLILKPTGPRGATGRGRGYPTRQFFAGSHVLPGPVEALDAGNRPLIEMEEAKSACHMDNRG